MRWQLLVILQILCTSLYAQQPTITRITTRDGLSQNNVFSILQDRYGYLWFSSDDGLNRYNGYDFEVFRVGLDKKNSLNSNLPLSLAKAPDHNIWIGTADCGINIYHIEFEKFTTFTPDSKYPNVFNGKRVIDIKFLPSGDVLILTPQKLYFCLKGPKGYQLKLFGKHHHLSVFDGAFKFICPAKANTFLVASIKGLYLLEIKDAAFQFRLLPAFKQNHIKSIQACGNGFLVASNAGLSYLDAQGNTQLLTKTHMNSLLVDSQQKLWAASKRGLHVFDIQTEEKIKLHARNLFKQDDNARPIAGKNIITLVEDESGVIWAGTKDTGLLKINKRGKRFKHLAGALADYRINAIFQDTQHKLWIGTAGGGAFLGERNKTQQWRFRPVDLGPKTSKNLLCFQELQLGKHRYVLSGTHFIVNHHKHRLSPNGQIENTTLSEKLDSIVHPVYSMAADSTYLWMATYGHGLVRYNYHHDTFVHFLPSNTNLPSKVLRSLLIDSKKRLWVGTDKGLCRLSAKQYDADTLYFEQYTHQPNNAHSISHNYILPIFESATNEIWIGTLGGGLNRYQEKTNDFEHITVGNGLLNNNIKAIVEDNNGHLWLSSNKGISQLEPQTNTLTNYDLTDGLQDYEFSDMASCKLHDGSLVFGGVNGLNWVKPNQIKKDTLPPKLVFCGLQVLNQHVLPQQKLNGRVVLEKNLNESTQLRLHYAENSFVVHFTALHSLSPKQIRYEYMLDGFDKDWVKTKWNARFAKYTSLLPGQYTLKVRARNSDGIQSQSPIYLPITIVRPFWLSNGAIGLYMLALVAIFFFLKRYSIIKINTKNALLMERFEKEKTNELTQLKLRFFTNISHEFRTPISIILAYLDQLANNWNQQKTADIERDFSIIKRNANSLLKLVNQLIDFRKFEQGKLLLHPTSGDIVDFVRQLYQSFSILAEKKQIEFSFDSDYRSLPLCFDHDKMEKILNNLLSNAFKYTPNQKQIGIRIKADAQNVWIQVWDKGMGIPADKQARIFDRFYVSEQLSHPQTQRAGIGLSFTKSLVEMHQGSIQLSSQVGQGTCFSLRFKRELDTKTSAEQQLLSPFTYTQHPTSAQPDKTKQAPDTHLQTNLLLVEDNLDLQQYLADNLSKTYNVLLATDGVQAWELCQTQNIDLIISDIMMPRMDGMQLCHALKQDERFSHIPLVLLTAKASEEAQIQGFNLGADAYLTKPFTVDLLHARISAIKQSRENMWKRFKENPMFVPPHKHLSNADQNFMQKLNQLIHQNIANSALSIEQLSQHFEVSHATFCKKVKAITGLTPNQFLRSVRLKKAAEMLLENKDSITDIIYNVGFKDLRYFREQFKKTYAVSPRDYRKTNGKHSSH